MHRSLECCLAATLLLVPTTAAQQTPTRAAAVEASHALMLEALETIRTEDLDRNPWLGEAPARAARESLEAAADAPAVARFRLLVELAEQELRLGDEVTALARLRRGARPPDRPDPGWPPS